MRNILFAWDGIRRIAFIYGYFDAFGVRKSNTQFQNKHAISMQANRKEEVA